VDHDEDVGHGDEPAWLLKCDEDVVVDGVAEDVVADERDGEVADGDDDVGEDDALPHGLLGRLVGRGRDGGLDVQHHVVARVRERHIPQRAQEVERLPRRHRRLLAVVHVCVPPLVHRRRPCNRRVAALYIQVLIELIMIRDPRVGVCYGTPSNFEPWMTIIIFITP